MKAQQLILSPGPPSRLIDHVVKCMAVLCMCARWGYTNRVRLRLWFIRAYMQVRQDRCSSLQPDGVCLPDPTCPLDSSASSSHS